MSCKLLLMVLCAAGCATTKSPVRPAPPILSMEIQALATGSSDVRALAPGGVLRSGDRFSVRVEADLPAYVYLVHRAAAENDEVIYPGKGAAGRLSPGQPLHLPGGETWYGVDEHVGTEHLLLVTSPRPLGTTQVLAAAKAGTTPGPERTRGEPPPEVPEKSRGERSQAIMQPAGVTVLGFWFRHE